MEDELEIMEKYMIEQRKYLRKGLYFKYDGSQRKVQFQKHKNKAYKKAVDNTSSSDKKSKHSYHSTLNSNCNHFDSQTDVYQPTDVSSIPSFNEIEQALNECIVDHIDEYSTQNSSKHKDCSTVTQISQNRSNHTHQPSLTSSINSIGKVKQQLSSHIQPDLYLHSPNALSSIHEPPYRLTYRYKTTYDSNEHSCSENSNRATESMNKNCQNNTEASQPVEEESNKPKKDIKLPDFKLVQDLIAGNEICERKVMKHNQRVKQRVRKRMGFFLQALESQSKMSMMIFNAAHKTSEMRPLFPSLLNRWSTTAFPSETDDPAVLIRLFTWLLGMETVIENMEEDDEKYLQKRIYSQLTIDDELSAINMMTNHFSKDDNVSLKATLGVLSNDHLFQDYVIRRAFMERRDGLILSIKKLKSSIKRRLEEIVESLSVL